MRRTVLMLASAALAAAPAVSMAASPRKGATVVERTASGYTMTLKVSSSGHSGRVRLACPSGSDLGKSSKFKIKHGKFKGTRRSQGQKVFSFKGRFDTPDHFKGSGKVYGNACGPAAPKRFSEPAPGEARMVSCPQSDSLNPSPANTPLQFAGVVPGAALGTRLRIEYTNPDGSTAVDHLRTDAGGYFTDTHAFAPSGGSTYGADAIPRYPDDGLAPGQGCSFAIR